MIRNVETRHSTPNSLYSAFTVFQSLNNANQRYGEKRIVEEALDRLWMWTAAAATLFAVRSVGEMEIKARTTNCMNELQHDDGERRIKGCIEWGEKKIEIKKSRLSTSWENLCEEERLKHFFVAFSLFPPLVFSHYNHAPVVLSPRCCCSYLIVVIVAIWQKKTYSFSILLLSSYKNKMIIFGDNKVMLH